MSGVSAFLITRNEAVRLPRTLAALHWVDEIVVVDSGSSDETVAIAEAAGARVVHRDWTGYGPQKVFAEQLCQNDWVLNVDADEVVTPALATEIQSVVAGTPRSFRVRILNVYPGDTRPRPGANDYNVVRLYHRSVAGYRDHPLFDRVESQAPIDQLKEPIHHFPLISFSHFVEKENAYSTYVAATAKPKSVAALRARLILEGPASFIKFYLFRRHFLGGWKGLAFSGVAAFSRWLRIVKLLERALAKDDP